MTLSAFLLQGQRSCVDDRDAQGVIGTPGGDAGELLLGLAATERVRGRALEQTNVLRLLEHHTDTFERSYMHSDIHAMNRLMVDGLRKDDRVVPHLGVVFAAEEWRAWLGKPPRAGREAVLFHLTRPTNIGGGHLKFAITAGADYGVRLELAEHLLRAFPTLRRAGAPEFEFVILGGDHVGGAVANVVVPGDLRSYTRVPLVSPMVAGHQMFVNHPQVTSFLRREPGAHLARADVVAAADTAALADAIEAPGQQQAGQTLGRLARGLPLFGLTLAHGSALVVRQTGVV
ncbi:MAG: hypothetical protein FJ137_14390 [Deltaproteobacteria bacterium]|nr:hypothetical protein [Deltaproteobacteria bacterium]